MENEKRVILAYEILKSKGENKDFWKYFYMEINNNVKNINYNTISILNNNLILNENVDLTLDIIDFICDYGSEDIISHITPDFLKNITNLMTNNYNTEKSVLEKILFLIKKWGTEYQNKEYFSNFRNIYENLKEKLIEFPPNEFLLETYLKYITLDDIKEAKEDYDKFKKVNKILNFNKTIFRQTLNDTFNTTDHGDSIDSEKGGKKNICGNIYLNINNTEGNIESKVDIREEENNHKENEKPIEIVNQNNNNCSNHNNNISKIGLMQLKNIDNNRSTIFDYNILKSKKEENFEKKVEEKFYCTPDGVIPCIKDDKNQYLKSFTKSKEELFKNKKKIEENDLKQINNNIIGKNSRINNINENSHKDMCNNSDIKNSLNGINNSQNAEYINNNNIQIINSNNRANKFINNPNNFFNKNDNNNININNRNKSLKKNDNNFNKMNEIENINSSIHNKCKSRDKYNPRNNYNENYNTKSINNFKINYNNYSTNNNNIERENYFGDFNNSINNKNNGGESNLRNFNNSNNYNIEQFKSEVGKKIYEINGWIDKGYYSFYNTYSGLLIKGIYDLKKYSEKCNELSNINQNNKYCYNILSKIKMDIEQTCQRYNNLNSKMPVYPFKSAFLNV